MTEDSGISESWSDDSEEAILTKMKLLAHDLEQKLSLDSNLVQEIAQVNRDKSNLLCKCVEAESHQFQTLKTSTTDLEERLQVERTINR